MTYTYVDQFYSLRTYIIFLFQTVPSLLCIHYPLQKRFPHIFDKKKMTIMIIFNLVFNFICSLYLYYFEIKNCITTYHIIILCLSFFQLLIFLFWYKIKNNRFNLYFVVNFLINIILLSLMPYIRLTIYSYSSNNSINYYLIELLPLFFILIINLIFNLLDTYLHSNILTKRLTTIFFFLFFYFFIYNIYPNFISIFGFSPNIRISIFEGFLFKNMLVTRFPNNIIIYSEPMIFYKWTGIFTVLGLVLILLAIFILFLITKQQIYINTIRQEKNLLEYILTIENIVKTAQKKQHDYNNILLTLSYYVKSTPEITNEFKEYFQKVLDDFELNMQLDLIAIPQLNNIKLPEVYSLILAKYQYAQYKNIDIDIDVPFVVNFDYFNTLNYCRILGILIDNAFNASLLCDHPEVSMSLISSSNKVSFIIQNNTISLNVLNDIQLASEKINLKNNGYGMSIVQSILDEYDQVTLDSHQDGYLFRQELIVLKA